MPDTKVLSDSYLDRQLGVFIYRHTGKLPVLNKLSIYKHRQTHDFSTKEYYEGFAQAIIAQRRKAGMVYP
ncbi:MAG: hypothetical protein KUG83_09145 [Gammaproteobacteria bacterium]|nr:hypothetical protein [Gammaproteobacteria bacterium]